VKIRTRAFIGRRLGSRKGAVVRVAEDDDDVASGFCRTLCKIRV
jgi:hypothetical protein